MVFLVKLLVSGVIIAVVTVVTSVLVCISNTYTSDISDEFIQHNLGGNPIFGWWSLDAPQPKEMLNRLASQLENHSTVEKDLWLDSFGHGVKNLVFSHGSAEKVANQMYEATKVSGVWEKVPKKFRGVFWMKDNGIAEELTVIQYGSWFEDDQTLIVPMAPYMWAWPAGKPAEAPFGGVAYNLDPVVSALPLLGHGTEGKPGATFTYKFDTCPAGRECEEGADNLAFANLQAHEGGDLTKVSIHMQAFAPVLPDIAQSLTGKFALEEVPGSYGKAWKRRCDWGVGGCDCFEFGSYNLKKIIDGRGDPIQPFYNEFLEYMGEVPLFVWSDYNQTESMV